MGSNMKKRKNNRNNKKNKIKKANKLTNASREDAPKQEDESTSHLDESVQWNERETNNSKRPYEENDSDNEEKPRKKKKKKQQAIAEETGDKKNKKSIRQMKKEKHLQRQAEAELAAKDQLKTQCLSYLSQWKHDKQNWKFMKAKQVWLYKNKFSKLLPNESWPLLLEYFESAQGNIRNMLLEDSNKIIKQMDEWTESQQNNENANDNENATPEISKPDDTTYKRARDLIQCLQ